MLTQAVATGDYLDTGDFAPLSLKGRLGWVDVDDGKHFEWDVSAYEPRTQNSPPPATTRDSHTRPAPRGRYDNFRVLARTGGERSLSSSRVCSFEELEDTRRRLGDVDPFDIRNQRPYGISAHTEPAPDPETARIDALEASMERRIDALHPGATGRRRAELVAELAGREAKLADAKAAEANTALEAALAKQKANAKARESAKIARDAKAAEANTALEAALAKQKANAKARESAKIARESNLSARIDEDDPFAAAAAGVSSHVSSSSSPPSSSSLFFNDGGMFGAARDEPREPEPPPSDEPDEDRKLAMSVQLTQQFSGELARLGLRVNDEIIRALKASNWDHYDAHEALDNLTRGLERYTPDAHEHEYEHVPGVSGHDGGGYADPVGQGNDDWGEDFDYKSLEREQREVRDGAARRATLGPAPVAPSDPSGDWRRPASDVLKVRLLCREFPRLDADVVERSLYEVYRGDIDGARHALIELEGQMLTKERKERMAESNRLAAASGASGQPNASGQSNKPGKAKKLDITRFMLGGATYLAGGGRSGSAREIVSSIMGDHTDDDEAKVMNEVRERQGGGFTGEYRGPAGQLQDIKMYHDELTVLRRSLNSLRAYRSNAVARKDHHAANGLRPEIDKLMKDIDFRTAKVNKLAAIRSSNANTELARLDLHGHTERDAYNRVLVSLSGALSMSYGGLKVITGAGHHSGAAGPRLRMMVTKLLTRHKVNYVYSPHGGSVVINW
jgi:DNA-nicking Smr family endonuclease